jgi:hypothetical protein
MLYRTSRICLRGQCNTNTKTSLKLPKFKLVKVPMTRNFTPNVYDYIVKIT